MSNYGQPSVGGGGDQFKVGDYAGRLVLLENIEPELHTITTTSGDAEVARADVTVLDGGPGIPAPPETFENTFIFGRALAPTLVRLSAKGFPTSLGRIGQGTAKPGQSAPWKLLDHTPADALVADQYIASRAQGRFAQPSAAPAAPAQPAPAAMPAQAMPDLSNVDPAQLQALLAQLGSKPAF